MGLQRVIAALYPPQCMACHAFVASDFGLCPACWRDTAFISGLTCCACGSPILGEPCETEARCDDCLAMPRPWSEGRAALLYRDTARRLVLALKHADRMELARPASLWLQQASGDLIGAETLIAPVPLHWWRLIRRKYNQAALLSQALAERVAVDHCPDLLLRHRSTGSQEGRSREERFANLRGAIRINPRQAARLKGRPVLIVDDVMTSGATFTAAAEACLSAGAARVDVLALARVAKDP
ncbi:ComF family protein [Xinfangfangia sp. CPCC 101601]|uniref:ComF family protein n=1 Tax=Pseudogemmobacter lacusdianii TaxID=3069608 RepID=A0ABU0VTU0_9RHOB|nr:ComF family protein [Xinfangfangia sp. CPCC 101601]MDQ2065149.1 ComF family protein [Xinfangfangia sp. CPCC 101601]